MPRYIFDPQILQEVANTGAGLPIAERWGRIHDVLTRRYPGKVYPRLRWVFNSAGNLVCQLALVYASPVEDLTGTIDGLLDQPEQLKDASAAAERVASDYRIERSLARLEQVYAELVVTSS